MLFVICVLVIIVLLGAASMNEFVLEFLKILSILTLASLTFMAVGEALTTDKLVAKKAQLSTIQMHPINNQH